MLIIYFDILVSGLVGKRTETSHEDLWELTVNKICLDIKYSCLPDTDNRSLIVWKSPLANITFEKYMSV